MRLLLRALYARVPGTARPDGFRATHLREEDGRAGALPYARAHADRLDPIAIGTATDPYQPAERKYGLTRSMLEVFAQLGGLDLSITTKSALIARDLDLLRAINSRSKISVNFSLMTLNRRLQRTLSRARRALNCACAPCPS